jgi:S-disulfanyl-L-cysteine oxidoreductase SoxD
MCRRLKSLSLLLVAAVLWAGVATVRAQGASTWTGVYSEDQAKRGETLYTAECASCHGVSLTGGEMAPALAGGDFNSNWNDLSLGDLVERIRISMPLSAPGSLSRQQCADILAYMLKAGSFPAGATELPSQLDALKGIKFLSQKP